MKPLKRLPLRACSHDEYSQIRRSVEMQPGVAEFLNVGIQALMPKHAQGNSLEDVDNVIQHLMSPVEGDHPDIERIFSQGLYFAFCQTLATMKAQASATAELLVLRLREAEARIAELEAAPKLEYAGVYVSSRNYVPGQFVTYAGSLWHCKAPTGGKSGFDKSCWTLAVKRGVDAKPVLTVAA